MAYKQALNFSYEDAYNEWKNVGQIEQDAWRKAGCAVISDQARAKEDYEKYGAIG